MDTSSIHCQLQLPAADFYNPAPELFGFPIPGADTRNDDILNYDDVVPISCGANYHHDMIMSSSVPDCMAVPSLSEQEAGLLDFAGLSYNSRVFEPGDQEIISGLMETNNFWPDNYDHIASQNWGIQSKAVAKVEEPHEVKVGRYSVEEKKGRILRYLKKRNQRNFNKTIKYACRKTLADKRVRVRGRFAKNNEPSEEYETKTNEDHSFVLGQNVSFYNDSSLQMICSDDDWLQAAMAGLVYLPYPGGNCNMNRLIM